MKICLVTSFPPSRDALNEYGFHIANELRRMPGIELVILGDDHSSPQPELDDYKVVRCWKFNSLRNPLRVLQAIGRERPDVVWFNLGFASFGGKALPAFVGVTIPFFSRLKGPYTHVTLHQLMETVDLKDAGIRFPLLYKIGGFVATQILLFSDSVSVTMPAYRNVLVEKYGRGSIYVRRHGSFASRPEYPDFSQRGNPEHRILAFGKWGTYKRLEPILEAFDMVIKEVPEARLIIAGTDHPKTPGYLRSIQAKIGARSDVHFAGYVEEEDIPRLFQRSTLTVLPYTSSAGSSGIAHLASTYGVPIISSDIADCRRLAQEEGLAMDFFTPGNTLEMARSIVNLLQNRNRQVEMALQNMAAALRMSMPEIIREYLRTFELRKQIEDLRSVSVARRLPRWLPMRGALVRRSIRKMLRRPSSSRTIAAPAVLSRSKAATPLTSPGERLKTGTD
jgi:glycosyltransferase involved in cell wall biosynthesis